jgi:hypothetical protein
VDTGTAIPLEKPDTPFSGSIMLYGSKGCGILGLAGNLLDVTENVCYTDKLLGLIPTGFESFEFEISGENFDPTSDKSNVPKTIDLSGFSIQGCSKKVARGILRNIDGVARSFSFSRAKY